MLLCYLLHLLISLSFVSADDVLGCNGFVKSDLNIDLSKVFVKLFTKQGNLKDQTECAPTNGYYFIPLYDKGDYVIRVSTPAGWSFDPPEVAISVNGVNDPCTLGRDINFVFNGFAISGKVVSAGHAVGPAGIKISLHEMSSGSPAVKTTTTDKSGAFIFTSIKPGTYFIKASHSKWTLGKSEVKLTVKDSNGVIPDGNLNVLGYDVSGSVTSDNQPIAGVTFALYSDSKVKGVGCDETPLAGISNPNSHYVCHATSDANGKFVFPQLPPNDYTLVPQYRGSGTKFNISPTKHDFTVAHNSLVLPTVFKVQGFSVSGRVKWSEGGPPMAGANIILNGAHIATTDSSGMYTLDSMRATTYKLHFIAEGVKFNEVDVAGGRTISDVYPSQYKVSGTVTPPGPVLTITGGDTNIELSTDLTTGVYHSFLPPGQFSISVKPTSGSSTQYSPKERTIVVKDKILSNINFTQLRSTINGNIMCMGPCPDITVSMKPVDGGTVLQTTAKGGQYTFSNVMPGDYELFVENVEGRCWKKETILLSVTSEITQPVPFVQFGYVLPIVSSHATKVEYKSDDGKHKGEIMAEVGGTQACVPSPGPYTLTPVGCHMYEESSFRWSVNSQPVKLMALAHAHKFSLLSTNVPPDLKMTATFPHDPSLAPIQVAPILKKEFGRAIRIVYKVYLAEGSSVHLTPSSLSLLFTPQTAQLYGENACVDNSEHPLFTAEQGLVLRGRVITTDNKGLEGVAVSVISKEFEVVASLKSHSDGSYSSPPIMRVPGYKVKAEKEGYVISGPNEKGDFSAHKLAEIIVKVVDQADNSPLQGVLLSLSGAEKYRRNAQTSDEGQLSFLSLSPGEYFLRPMMKEYKFTPGSQTISVKEGETKNINLSGVRVAYSGIGVVASLNGDGEPGIVVEAVGLGNCSLLQEEAISGSGGHFRIRGLQSGCEYNVHVKKGADINSQIFKSSPDNIQIKVTGTDVTGLKLYAFRFLSKTDIIVFVTVERPDDMRTLRIIVSKEGSSDGPISSARLSDYKSAVRYTLSSVLIAMPAVPSDGTDYVVSLESSLARATHDYALRPVRVTADAPVRVARLSFAPVPRQRQPDVASPSSLSLPIAILALLGVYYRKNILKFVTSLSQAKSDDSQSSSFADKRKQKLKKM